MPASLLGFVLRLETFSLALSLLKHPFRHKPIKVAFFFFLSQLSHDKDFE
jgi:hypothetical protein